MSLRFTSRALVALLFLATALPGCGGIRRNVNRPGPSVSQPSPPIIEVVTTRLSRAPGRRDIAQHYCMERAPTPLICRAFGPLPEEQDLRFAFDVELEMQNPTGSAMPVVQALFAFTAFPESDDEENLGAVCMSFCEDPEDCAASADACHSDEPEIRDLDDFRGAVRDFLFSVARGERRFEDLRVRTIPPGETMRLVVRLELEHEQIFRLIRQSVGSLIEGAMREQMPEITIPFRLEGSAWVSIEGLGRIAAGFGPIEDEWNLTETIRPQPEP